MLFSRGKTEDKLRIIFDMCDNDRNGVIDKGELSEMLRSLVEIARTTSLSDEHVTELIEGMFQVSNAYPKMHHHNLLNFLLGCRFTTQRLPNLSRLQRDDEGIQGRFCCYRFRLQRC